ncbi:hypothetical protein FGSG_02414 [Fusarium graminearum PH-1]|uniref:Chromosome 1, complete genome n=1 Tax=Gibberella zeae (strain ATCC MYA-4620 / CBS 123657 / FGSC 9075 / NRRL 31084 / PH-1) TaxID=229533 RepID=I1RFE0_GIBZE|nr:hypothetical protein FGSG_02414 [Fusarium graminearum PH-1]ESU07847.1 hypothetical protein FGSG_02414 [Fusarium graminearum PH-1]CEF74703.1 unnamed protein product [Fusarium graminearum]|eukprot:XP_011318332.1 hypothetical protein FGSG_02414 [Fusarium graminearum PH-1]
MHEVEYTDYKLFPAAFEAWLRAKFDDPTITVEVVNLQAQCKNGHFVFNLPDDKYLTEHCSESLNYPCNLQKPCQPRRTLNCHRKLLIKSKSRLFDAEKEEVAILEFGEREQKSSDSRAPLNCSYESFVYLSSFYQIPASFLDFISSFGFTKEPKDYHLTGFSGFDTLDKPTDDLVQIPRLGRSGCVHGTQYLLRSVEQSTGPMGETTWNIRQMAVHHQYDLITGKALWLTVKTNSLMQEMIKEAIVEDPSLSPTPAEGLSKSFAATLLTHLIHLQWCDESWRLCINDFEERIRTVLSKAKTARVHQQSGIHTTVKRALTGKSNTNADDGLEKQAPFKKTRLQFNKNGWEALTSYLCLTPTTGNTSEPVPREKEMVKEGVSNQLKSLIVLDTFSINEAQKLHDIGEHLENFRLVLKLNRQTLRDITEHYQDLESRDAFPSQIKIPCKAELASFTRHVERVRKNLEIRVTQIESLIAWLNEGKVLFDGILQYRNTQVSHIFTESSHIQSEKMEKIAYKTEKETISMHVITCVTLAFLPGTFVAAFFQSGLVEINQAASGVRGAVTFHSGAFKLFASICFPLMFITFVLWILLFQCLARRARRREEQGKV